MLLKVVAFPVPRPEGNMSAAQPPSRYVSAGVLHAWVSLSCSRGGHMLHLGPASREEAGPFIPASPRTTGTPGVTQRTMSSQRLCLKVPLSMNQPSLSGLSHQSTIMCLTQMTRLASLNPLHQDRNHPPLSGQLSPVSRKPSTGELKLNPILFFFFKETFHTNSSFIKIVSVNSFRRIYIFLA